jgi:pimeloyl-ACP methyl ester carboxylesterase
MSSRRKLLAMAAVFGLHLFSSGCTLADEAKSQTFKAKGVKIHYLTAGKGEPVVLLHGLLSSADINWRLNGVFGELAKDHQVIALDFPGHGKSDKPKEKEAYGVQLVEDVALLFDELKIKKAHVVGYSMGGMAAVKFMATHPDRVLSGTVCGMGFFKEGSPLAKFWENPKAKDGLLPAAMFTTIGKLAVTEEDIKKIKVPVKVLIGDGDVCKALYVDPLKKVKDWPIVEIEDADHFTCILKKQFREEIVSWVKKNTK